MSLPYPNATTPHVSIPTSTDMAHGGYGTSQLPLAGAILCCTSIPPEQRSELGAIGAQMGATIKLDLTSDVTHLIVGNTSSAKYRYVAKSRDDVRVLLPAWLEAMRTEWMKGGDVDVASLELQYRLPTFYGLRICLTGFDDPDQRKHIQLTVSQQGAEYHGDLTKSVTHLIAAAPSGKKYEHAVNWNMKIVTLEWFQDSCRRGLVLDEEYYKPTMPPEERGKGAWERRRTSSPLTGKRTREPGTAEVTNLLRRKLRRSASSRLGSQSEALWAGITSAALDRKHDEADDWTETNLLQQEPKHSPEPAVEAKEPAEGQVPQQNPASRSRGPFLDDLDGIFAGSLVYPYGFDQSKTAILREHLDANGAVVVREGVELQNFTSADLVRGYLVVPHDVPMDHTTLPDGTGEMTLVTNWWVERCLHAKSLVDPESSVLCKPFDELSVIGFNHLIINITGFTGIELLQVTKAISLFGATYDEMLSAKTSVMICNTRRPNPEKLKFASDKSIPALHAEWLWECIRSGQAQPYEKYLLNRPVAQPQNSKARESFAEVPTAPLSEEDSLRLVQKRAQSSKPASKPQGGLRRHGALELTLSGPPTPASTTGSSTSRSTNPRGATPEHDAQLLGRFDGNGSQSLQEIALNVDSCQQSSSNSSTRPNSKPGSIDSLLVDSVPRSAPLRRGSRLAREPSPDSVIPAGNSLAAEGNDTPLVQEPPKPPLTDYSDVMSKLLANRKTSTTSDKDPETGRRRRKPLGRAPSTRSNQSTADNPLSRQSSTSYVGPEFSEVAEECGVSTVKRPFEIPEPSQELGWDSPGAQKAREKMILAMGGKVDGALNVLEGIGVVKDKATDEGLNTFVGRTTRKRRG